MVRAVEAPGTDEDEVATSWGWDPQWWMGLQEADSDLAAVRAYLEQGCLPGVVERQAQTRAVRQILGQWERLGRREGVVCRSVQDPVTHDEVHQVVVPGSQIQPLLHDQAGHQGQERTVSLLRRCFYWSGMEASVSTFIQDCPRCMLFKARREVRAPMVPMWPKSPLHIVAMDFLTLG